MKTTKDNQGNKFQISLDSKYSMEDLKEWDTLIMNVLLLAKGQRICLITLDPQSNSIGYELGNYQKIKRGRRDHLINWYITLSEDFIHFITESEDFKRGLLFLVLSESIKDIFKIIDTIDSVGSIDFSKLEVEIIVLEDDGKTLAWNNPTKEIRLP
jgi:hypothetical protein